MFLAPGHVFDYCLQNLLSAIDSVECTALPRDHLVAKSEFSCDDLNVRRSVRQRKSRSCNG
jgi:hypothetical protein